MTAFWRTWLTVWCIGVGVFGLVLAGAAFPATDGAVRLLFQVLDGPGETVLDAHMRFSVGLMGAVTLGWSITLHGLIQAALRWEPQGGPAWRNLLVGMAVWYLVDGVISVATGFWLNAVSNTVISVALLVPLIRTGVLRRA